MGRKFYVAHIGDFEGSVNLEQRAYAKEVDEAFKPLAEKTSSWAINSLEVMKAFKKTSRYRDTKDKDVFKWEVNVMFPPPVPLPPRFPFLKSEHQLEPSVSQKGKRKRGVTIEDEEKEEDDRMSKSQKRDNVVSTFIKRLESAYDRQEELQSQQEEIGRQLDELRRKRDELRRQEEECIQTIENDRKELDAAL